jgi:hypothetical protein
MKKIGAIGGLAAAIALMLGAGPAQAAIITTGINANNGASSTDLLQTHLSSAVLSGSWNEGVASPYGGGLLDNATPLYNGTAVLSHIYNPDAYGTSTEYLLTGNNNRSVVTFTLDTSGANALGYAITQIDFFHGWSDNGRDAMNFKIQYSTVSAPGTFLDYGTSTYFDPSSNYGISRITDGTGTIATGVAAVRLSTPSVKNNWGGISEIDVIGTVIPEPASLGMLGAAAAAMLLRRRFRG